MGKTIRKTTAYIAVLALTFAIALFVLPTTASAATELNINNASVEITEDGDYIIKGTGETTTNTITVASGVSASITLAGVNINVSGIHNVAAFEIADDSTGDVTVILADGTVNTLISGNLCAGLQKNGDIEGIGKLTIKGETLGTGSLTATGGTNGAGIGSNYGAGSNITISGGVVTATGGSGGAGIGGSSEGAGSNITISGGEVTATGGSSGAGVGGGNKGAGSNITISGGEVTATGGSGGAGVGGGYKGAGSNITISGGKVTATSDGEGAGIGGGSNGVGSYITISGGEVTATGGNFSAGIGGGSNSSLSVIMTGSNIKISGGTVIATGGNLGAGIGGGLNGSVSDITISGDAIVTAAGNGSGAGIGGGISGSGSKITINGGKVTATGGDDGAGIGGGNEGAGSYITINGGEVTATGGIYSAGIGGSSAPGSYITINGGKVIATGGNYGTGIGGGGDEKEESLGFDITISGGEVTATGGERSAGIGSARSGDSLNIKISGGKVIATGGFYGAGIGSGENGDCLGITISGGFVYVTAGNSANSIGGGRNGNGAADLSETKNSVIVDNTAKTIAVYGNVTLTEDFEVPTDYTMTIPVGATLTINTGVTLTNNGTIENNGTIINNGTITGNAVGGNAISYDFIVTGGVADTDYTYVDGVLTIKTATALTISNKDPKTATTNRIEVASGVSANITLAGVNIDVSGTSYVAAFKIADNSTGDVTITLADGSENILKSGDFCAGLQFATENKTGMLIINGGEKGTGILTAKGGYTSAGIGGAELYSHPSSTNITINGGVINAEGGYQASGIGSGIDYSPDKYCTIIINGGTINAQGGKYGVGIGGSGSVNTEMTINGGNITASGGQICVGIGSFYGSLDLKITGGNIIANGGTNDPEAINYIGGHGIGDNSTCTSSIEISGGTITATGGIAASGIGGTDNIKISGGTVKAVKGEDYGDFKAFDIGHVSYLRDDEMFESERIIPVNEKGEKVYLLVVENPAGSDIKINGTDYPDKHFDEKKIYVYLPDKPCEVTVGTETTIYYYDTATEKWLKIIEEPVADDTVFTYNGKEQIYTIAESEFYTITGNKQTNAGEYTVKVALADGYMWNDVTTADKEYKFTIAKADLVIDVKTTPSSDIAGKTITVTSAAKNLENVAITDAPTPVLTYKVGENGTETEFKDSFVIPDGTAIGTEIIVTAKIAVSNNYNAATATAKVVVTDCKHTDVQTKWTFDGSSHWHTCSCGEKFDNASHDLSNVSSSGVNLICSVCKYSISYSIPSTGTTTTTTTTTTKPADTSKPDDNATAPQIKGEDSKQGWELIEDEIKDAENGDKIVVDMNGATEVPKDILKQLKGKDIDVVIELDNGFTWTINGKDVTKPITIDLGIGDEENIPVEIINNVTGEREYKTFAINHDGDFGFTATLTIDMGVENEGYYANLYWYTNGHMEFICADKINAKGMAELTFTHASEYVIVIDEENHGKRAEISEDVEEDIEEDTDDTDADDNAVGEVDGDTIITGEEDDDANPPTGVAISFAGVVIYAAAVLLTKKRNK